MRGQRSNLISRLTAAAHAEGGWCKEGSARSLTVTAEVVVGLSDYYAQAPIAPDPTEAILLEKIDKALVSAEQFIVDEVKRRDASAGDFDPPNCALALAAYLMLRAHRTEKGIALPEPDKAFIEICLRRARLTDAWLQGKAGAIWACVKAYQIIWKYLAENSDTTAISELKTNGIDQFASRLQTQLVRVFQGEFPEDRKFYNASVVLDLSYSVSEWANDIIFADIKSATSKSLAILKERFREPRAASSVSLSDFYIGSPQDQHYQVVAPAALLTALDKLLKSELTSEIDRTFWQPIFYAVADEMDKFVQVAEPVYVVAHHLRALTASELPPREVALIRKMYRDQLSLIEDQATMKATLDDSLGSFVARFGNPGDRTFFVAAMGAFIVYTLMVYIPFMIALLASENGSTASIAAAFGMVVALTPLSAILWARKEKLHEKGVAERTLSMFQFFVAGGWIAIPIFVAFLASWIKNIVNAQFGH